MKSVVRRSGRLAAPLGHELIELGAVPGEAQPRKEILELLLLLFEALQRLGAIVVEGAVAAGRGTEPIAGASERSAFARTISIFSCKRVILRSQRSRP